ncbi:tetratricopeptide repeat protein [Aequorivita sp. SDUM287046]|uniref:Tetratricopeptide repeat protein n=1 Tax=Aequorivita aurantiaca TaxID=3053356 RepID=A0ABT8DJD6_9FLAO|nr:tetratricopeptide repeat protein [Aequorivita aurantiaca]MDN3725490.1 tetratricopeptide repeat protein [Aequorivita aurantiaca]
MVFSVRYIVIFFLLISSSSISQTVEQKECDALIEKGIELMFSKKHVQSLELLVKAASIAEENRWPKQKFRALLNSGSNYYLMSDFGEALDYYLKAYEIAIEELETKDELTVLNNIGILYFQESNLAKAKEYFGKAYALSLDGENNSKRGYYAINLALVLNKMQQPEEASKYIQEALPLVKEQPEVEIMARMARAENLFIRRKFSEAKELSRILLPQLKGEANADNRVFILLLLSQILQKENNFSAALQYAEMARKGTKGIEHSEDVYEALSKAYMSLKDYHLALRYKDSVLIARDSLHQIRNNALYENNKIKFELQSYAHELNESRLLLQKERRFFYSITAFASLLFLLLIWIFRNYLIRHKQRKKITELELDQEKTKRLVVEKQMREQEAVVKLEQERLRNELDIKNRKLTSKALYLSGRNELIEEIVETLTANPQIKEQPEMLVQIKALSKHLKKNPQLESFFSHFEEVNPGFTSRLLKLNPHLTQQDVRFIIYLYMNLGNNEIASLLNISPQSCRKRKERIAKKLNLPNDASLAAYIANI